MGVDAGFDMVPRLSQGYQDSFNWKWFISVVKQFYADDERVEIRPRVIEFEAGEGPSLPIEAHKFLRFGSNISGRIAAETEVKKYIMEVQVMAKFVFGDRIRPWTELADQLGFYRWDFVYASRRSYELDIPYPEPIPLDALKKYRFHRDQDPDLYAVMAIPSRGKGLVAKVDIPKGTRILCEKPLFTVASSSIPAAHRDVAEKLKSLPKDKQREFLSLHNNFPGKYAFAGVVRTNALPCGPGSSVGGIYVTICLVNHSCIPNAHNNWNGEARHETIHAIRDIRVGEEILISYEEGMPSEARHEKLRTSFGFRCSCELCSRPFDAIQASDGRRAEIEQLDNKIGNLFAMRNSPEDSLAACHGLLRMLGQEYGDVATPLLARLYYDAFQISIAHGDQARASVFAERAYMVRVDCEGEDSPATQKNKGLMQDPTKHSTFSAYSTRWRSTKTAKPRNLDEGSFDKWLWRLPS